MDKMKSIWSQLEAEALTLNGESDALHEIIAACEEKLASLDLQIEASVELAQRNVAGLEESPDVQTVMTCLKYADQDDGNWFLCVQEIGYDDGEMPVVEGPKLALSDCGRNVCIEALSSLDRLLKNLEMETQRKTEQIRRAKNTLTSGLFM